MSQPLETRIARLERARRGRGDWRQFGSDPRDMPDWALVASCFGITSRIRSSEMILGSTKFGAYMTWVKPMPHSRHSGRSFHLDPPGPNRMPRHGRGTG
jgi:hypothetical protein